MTTTSYGFTGSLNAATWAQGEGYRGARVKSSGDLVVTAVGGSRAVQVGTGECFSSGVRAAVTAAETVNLSTPSQGQWFLITAHRDWASNATTFVALAGPTTSTATPTSAPTSAPGNYASTPGAAEDQPLAWAWVNFSSTTVTLFDVRAFVSDGIPVTSTTAGLYLLKGAVGQLAATIDGTLYQRTASNTWTTFSSQFATAQSVTNAQNTANSASSAASSAQGTANAAQSAASSAQGTANSAQSAANGAQGAANNAQSTANAVGSQAGATGSGASGWTVNRFSLKKVNHIVHVDISVSRNGAAIVAGPTGNIGNIQIGSVPWHPNVAWAGLAPGPGGPVTACAIDSNGAVWLAALPPNYTVANGSEITAGGSYPTDS